MITVVVLAAVLAVALSLFGVAVVLAADQADERDADLEALILSQEFVDELNVEADRWRWGR